MNVMIAFVISSPLFFHASRVKLEADEIWRKK